MSAAHRRVAIDHPGQVIDEFDDQLGQLIGWCHLAGEEERLRHHLEIRVSSHPFVEYHNAQGIE
jgi:hypothetical protein